MKLKELKRTVNVSWSPAEQYPILLAAGSAGQQVDASFSSNAYLELYGLNLQDSGLDLELKSSLQTQHKFQKLVWSGANIIVGGCDGGLLEFYSADKLLKNSSDALLGSNTKHNGHVSALDINPYQKNLLASGASESEIFIWDLNNTSQPMAPGNKSQPLDHVQGLAWNQQVQHILGSTFATRCVVWDLRKNEPIMKLSDSQSRTRWRSLAWHPSVATQLCIASEDDLVPVIQVWDLRLAASPLVTLEGHNKGVMAVAWCKQDSDLLLSAGKDGRVLCWNPNDTRPGGELLLEVVQQPQWILDVSWCPREPTILAASSFDQQLGLHSLLGGSTPSMSTEAQSNNILESFGAASLRQLPAMPTLSPRAPRPQLPRAPRWLRAPLRASFAFGGKLVTFENTPQEAGPQNLVYISQVVSEPEIVEKAAEVDAILNSCLSQDPNAAEQLAEYCRERGDACAAQSERYSWWFLRASLLPSFRGHALDLLGFKQDDITSKFKSTSGDATQPDLVGLSRDAHTLIERKLANLDLGPTVTNVVIPNGEDPTSLICRALVCGNLEEAVELCLEAKRIADALIIASLGSPDLLYKVQKYHLKQTATDPVSLVAGSLLQSKWDALVSASAAASWRHALAALVTHCEGDALSHYCEMLGDKLSKESDPALVEAASICYLCAMSPNAITFGLNGTRWSADDLARLTFRALLMKRAALARGREIQPGGKIDAILEEYALRLASQGCLRSALGVLRGDGDLRRRLRAALELPQNHAPAQPPAQRTRTTSHPRRSVPHNDVNAYQPVASPYEPQPWQQASVPASSPFPPPPQPGGLPPQPGYLPPQPPQPLQPPANPPQPPRPGSVGPQSGGISSRSKYKVDPSVQAAPLYNQYSFNNQQQCGGYNSPMPDQYNASSVPNQMNPMANQMNPMTNPLNPMANQLNPLAHPANPVNPAVNGGYYTQQQAEPTPPVPSKPVPPGWNDPPMLSSKPKPILQHEMSALHAGTRQWGHIIEHRRHWDEPKPEVSSAPAPITHPLFGAEPPQHVPLNPAMPQQYQQQLPQQMQQQYGYDQFAPQYGAPPQNLTRQTESPAPASAPGPVPQQHAVIQNVFDALRAECASRAPNPQTKRKLEDVQRRLETLYDMLREDRLSESALSVLHSCAAHAQRGEAASAAQLSAALAAGADFAAVAGFLPGLRVLLQLAAQLQVSLR
ncbi:protein transport protein Sec31A isoform X2 [Plodia interpunctella]|uniref:protein transport protein Sec31A isoform X2 n=1 Tax=Plodia interpunctella TaxID=58824 RepID=UPI0023686763|nr:protein transport protein Sec31A isoform X2 [Plodia interpunctella]